ncbi:MAG: glycosyltransferase family 1 protein [Ardenticatenia bacterium]|nr:glycosyltransferase family 1 protein [Ardenticatenia bacterium]
MRVALNAHFWGRTTTGSGQYLHALVNALCRLGLEVILIADEAAARQAVTVLPPPHATWYVASTPFDGRLPHVAKVWFEQVAAPRLAMALDAQLYHVPYFAPPWAPSLPTVATVHDLIPLRLPAYRGSPLVRLYTALVARAARRTDRLLADSEATRQDILELLTVPPERVRTVYLAVAEGSRCIPPDVVARVRRAWPHGFVLYVGGFDVRKRVPLLLKALRHTTGEWPLVVAGPLPQRDTPFTPDPRRVALEAGVDSRVFFLGRVSEGQKWALLHEASLFAFPSIYEGFGLPVLEALSCGTPVVAAAASSLPELVGQAGRLVPPDDEHALASALDALMADGAERRRLAALAVEQASRFSWERTTAQTVAVYDELIGA